MHELHLVENLLESVLAQAKEDNHSKIVAINITLGKDSMVNDENLKFLMELKCRETVADGAVINVQLSEGKKVFVKSIDVD